MHPKGEKKYCDSNIWLFSNAFWIVLKSSLLHLWYNLFASFLDCYLFLESISKKRATTIAVAIVGRAKTLEKGKSDNYFYGKI